MKKILMDIQGDKWVIADRKNKLYGSTKSDLQNYINLLTQKNQVIILNGSLQKLIDLLHGFGYMNNKEYKIETNYKLEKISVTIFSSLQNNKVVVKQFKSFFARDFNFGMEENLDKMWEDIEDFETVSGIKNWVTSKNLDYLVRSKLKSFVDWDQNYAGKIDKDTFLYLRNWSEGAFRFINEDKARKIIKTSEYDVNSYYQWIWENKPMPAGFPIFKHDKKQEKECEEKHLTLIHCVMNGTLKQGMIPILKKKQINFDFRAEEEYIYDLFEEEIFCTWEKFEMIKKFYEIENIAVLDYICFEKYEGDGWHKANELFNNIRNNIKNKELKKSIKLFENKFIGTQISTKMIGFKEYFVSEVEEGKLKFGYKNSKRDYIPYAPLYLFITDFGRNRMSQYVQDLMPYVVASNTDSITIDSELSQEEISKVIEIDQTKLGAFKYEGGGEYSWYMSPTHYLRAKTKESVGDIDKYKWSGAKNLVVDNLSLEEAAEKLNEITKMIEERDIF